MPRCPVIGALREVEALIVKRDVYVAARSSNLWLVRSTDILAVTEVVVRPKTRAAVGARYHKHVLTIPGTLSGSAAWAHRSLEGILLSPSDVDVATHSGQRRLCAEVGTRGWYRYSV